MCSSDLPLAVAAGYLVRHLATGRDLPSGAQNVMNLRREFMENQARDTLQNVGTALSDQTEFAKFSRQMIADLGYGDQLGDDPDVLCVDIDLARSENVRRWWPFLRDRRIDAYGDLTQRFRR